MVNCFFQSLIQIQFVSAVSGLHKCAYLGVWPTETLVGRPNDPRKPPVERRPARPCGGPDLALTAVVYSGAMRRGVTRTAARRARRLRRQT